MTLSRRSILGAISAGFGAVLVGCDNTAPTKGVPTPADLPKKIEPSMAVVKQYGNGFTVGNTASGREVAVFFDPMCKHCAFFWLETKKLHDVASFTWYPVNAISDRSLMAGAAILVEEDKVAVMDKHAAEFFGPNGEELTPNVPMRTVTAEQRNQMEVNLNLMANMGATGVPYYVSTHEKSGQTVANARTLAASAIVLEFGWDVPVKSVS